MQLLARQEEADADRYYLDLGDIAYEEYLSGAADAAARLPSLYWGLGWDW